MNPDGSKNFSPAALHLFVILSFWSLVTIKLYFIFYLCVTYTGPRNPFSELGACKMPLAQLLDYLGQIFEFFYTDVLCGNQQVRVVATTFTILY